MFVSLVVIIILCVLGGAVFVVQDMQITAHTSSKGACSQAELAGVQRRGDTKSTGGRFCSLEQPGGGQMPGRCQLNLHCRKDLGRRLSRICKNFTYTHPTASDSF